MLPAQTWDDAYRTAWKKRAMRKDREACDECPGEVLESVGEILVAGEEATANDAPVPEEVIMRQLRRLHVPLGHAMVVQVNER